MAINSTLEATKHRQAKEIRDLRRRLRESRLILPPPAYRAVKSSLHKSSHPDDPNATNASSDFNSEDEDDDEDEGEDESVWEGRLDETYNRVKGMMEVLLEQGQKALEAKPEELLGTGKGGTRVLSEEEARTWRGEVDVDGNASSGLMSLRRHDEDDNVDDDEDEEGRGKKPKMLSTSSRILVLNTLNNRPPLSPSEDTSFTEEDRSLSRLDVDSEEEEGESFIEDDLDLVPPIRGTHSS